MTTNLFFMNSLIKPALIGVELRTWDHHQNMHEVDLPETKKQYNC